MKRLVIIVCCLLTFCITTLSAHIRLPPLVGDSMILQRDTPLKIWGWADKGERIKVNFNKRVYTTITNAEGQWMVTLHALAAGGPYVMHIEGSNNRIKLRDILIGDVWLCAGQSNMVHSLALHQQRYQKDITSANYSAIRNFIVPSKPDLHSPQTNTAGGHWTPATTKNILSFSVVAFFFARNLYDRYHVPIGIINASVGGTPVEAWTSEEGLKTFQDIATSIQRNKDTSYVNSTNRMAAARMKRVNALRQADQGLTDTVKWHHLSSISSAWHRIAVPGYWEDQGLRNLDGVVWYRKEIDVPASMTGKRVSLSLGRIVDADEVYMNGTLVGSKTYQYPQRRYDISSAVLKTGKNTIVVRVINYAGKGGFVPDKPYHLATAEDTLDLTGYWSYRVGEVYKHEPGEGGGIVIQNQPTALYNGMIAPIVHYKLKGVVWYQGESNTQEPAAYAQLFPALINDWRTQWNQNDLPFLYVQLPNYMDVDWLPTESEWASLRDAQLKTLQVSHTAMVVAIDLGEWNDIHPGNKKPIGDRLALAARHVAYHEKDILYAGPLYASATVHGRNVTLTFTHTGGGIISQDQEPLKWFTIAAEDKKFVTAQAIINGNKVVVSSEEITNPVYVRYAWANNPDQVNFYNREGLPAAPFEARVAEPKLWQGKSAAVILTYDDALYEHLDNAIPALDALGLKATFYLSADSRGFKDRLKDWERVAINGHELGNHTLYHPCDGSKPGRSWVSPANDLHHYTTAQLVREVDMTNVMLEALDGKHERTFAYPCGDTATMDGSFVHAIENEFVAMRGVTSRLNTLDALDFTNIHSYSVEEQNADQLISWAEKAKAENAMLVLLFHGVGGGHSLNVPLQKHNDFLMYLKSQSQHYWVTTMLEASAHSKRQREKKND